MMRSFLHRHSQLLAYLVLVAAVIYSLGAVQHESSNADAQALLQRQSIVNAGVTAVRLGCVRDTQTRVQIRVIIRRALPNYQRLYTAGTITKDQYDGLVSSAQKSLDSLTLPNCSANVKLFLHEANLDG